MRRPVVVLLATAGLAAAGGTAATLASAGDPAPAAATTAAPAVAQPRHHAAWTGAGRARARRDGARVVRAFADRLGITPAQVRRGAEAALVGQLDRLRSEGTLTATQHDVLAACVRDPRGCDRLQAFLALHAVRGALDPAKLDLPALKDQLSGDFAVAVGKSRADVLTAARAQLSALLDRGVAAGFVPAAVQAQALGCFDDPATCDVTALRSALGHRHHP